MKWTIGILGGLVLALGVWKMVDDLVVFRRTVEARFAKPSRNVAQGDVLRSKQRRSAQEAKLPDGVGRFGAPARYAAIDPLAVGAGEGGSLLLPADPPTGIARSKARTVADTYVSDHRASWGVREYHELRGEEFPGPLGTEVRYKVYQDGLEVMGLELRVEVDANGSVTETGNNYLPMARADLSQPELAPDEAIRRSGVADGDVASAAMSARRVLFAGPGAEEPELGFAVSLDNDPNGPSSAIVRASDGQPLARNFARR